MKQKLVVAVLVVAVGTGLFLVGRYSKSGDQASKAKRVLYYVDPMHPSYRSDRPGTAPDCGMALEPVYEGDDPAATLQLPPGAVVVNSRQRQLLGIRVELLKANSGRRALRTTGRVVADENTVYRILAGSEGLIRTLGNNAPGTLVRRDEVLATFFTSDLLRTQQAYIFALKTLERVKSTGHDGEDSLRQAEEQLRAAEGELGILGMGEAQLKELAKTRDLTRDIRIASPADGLVLARNITAGQRLERGEELYRIANLDRVWIIADLPDDFPPPRAGESVPVTVPGTRRTFTATVSSAVPLFDPAARTLKLRLEAANPGLALRPDMFVDVDLNSRAPAGLSVPLDAIVNNGKRKLAYVESSENVFEPRTVETGSVFGDRVLIKAGLKEGDRVVTAGNFMVDSESRMKAPVSAAEMIPAKAEMPSVAKGTQAKHAAGAVTKDPVCGMDVAADAAEYSLVHDNKTYLFCSDHCRRRFQEHPEQYTAKAGGGR